MDIWACNSQELWHVRAQGCIEGQTFQCTRWIEILTELFIVKISDSLILETHLDKLQLSSINFARSLLYERLHHPCCNCLPRILLICHFTTLSSLNQLPCCHQKHIGSIFDARNWWNDNFLKCRKALVQWRRNAIEPERMHSLNRRALRFENEQGFRTRQERYSSRLPYECNVGIVFCVKDNDKSLCTIRG